MEELLLLVVVVNAQRHSFLQLGYWLDYSIEDLVSLPVGRSEPILFVSVPFPAHTLN